jgi:hypothetical protein
MSCWFVSSFLCCSATKPRSCFLIQASTSGWWRSPLLFEELRPQDHRIGRSEDRLLVEKLRVGLVLHQKTFGHYLQLVEFVLHLQNEVVETEHPFVRLLDS